MERIYFRHQFHDGIRYLYTGGGLIFAAGDGDERKLADFLGSIPDRVSADPDRIFRIAKEHDRGSDLRWSEGIDRRKRKYESKCSITYTHVQYAYGTDEEHIVIRLRAGRGDLTECILHYGDRACRLTPVLFTEQRMAVVAQTEEFDYWETTLEHPYKRLCYYFTLSDGREEVLYYGERFTDHTVDDRSEYYQLPFNHRADIVTPPEWAQDTIIYNIFPDSFATEYRYLCGRGEEKEWGGVATRGKLGGTIRGICENVEYLKNLGVNAIYINPIFVAGEYHKYDLLDYFHIDPCFGTDDDFHRLIDVFHANGLKVIIDGVFNHCGWYFFRL